MSRTRWRILLSIFAMLSVFAFAAACGDDDHDTGGTTPGATTTSGATKPAGNINPGDLAADQTYKPNLSGEPATLDPSSASFSTELSVIENLFRGPFKYDGDLKLVADMAESVPSKGKGISADGLTYEIKLKAGLKWSDGKPITSQDLAFALRRSADPRTGGDYQSFLWEIKGGDKLATAKPTDPGLDDIMKGLAIETPDDRTVKITLGAPNAVFLNYLGLWIAYPLREDVIKANGDQWIEPGKLVSSGPFVLKEWQHKDHITLTPNPEYYGEKPTATIRFAMIEDVNQAFNAYKAGQLDQVTIPSALFPTVKADPALDKQRVTIDRLATFRVSPDNKKAPFDNKDVRLAFAYAIDRKALVDVALKGVGSPAQSFIPPGMPGYDSKLEPNYNPEKAKQYLKDAGFPNGQGFPKVVFTYANSSNNPPLATFLKEQWKQVLNIDVELDPVDSKTFQDKFKAGQVAMAFVGWGADYPDPENFLVPNLKTGAGNNKSNYSNKAFDDLLAKGQVETDREKALKDYYGPAQKMMQADSPDIFLFYSQFNVLRNPKVKGIVNTAMDHQVLGDKSLEKVKIVK